MKVEVLPVSAIELPEWAGDIRLRLPEVVRELKRSIMAYGFTVPIIVARRDDGFVLLDGITRYLAARELGMAHVPAIITSVSEDVSDVALFVRALDLNLAQAGLGPVSKLKAVAYLVRKGWTVEDACRRVGVSPSWFRTYRHILELSREEQERLERGEYPLSEALRAKEARTATYASGPDAHSATSRPSGRRSSKRALECFLCGRPIKAHEKAWRPFHRSCLEVLDRIMESAVEVRRTGNFIEARCRRCGQTVFWAQWTGSRWVVSTELPLEGEGEAARPTPPGGREPGAREAGEEP